MLLPRHYAFKFQHLFQFLMIEEYAAKQKSDVTELSSAEVEIDVYLKTYCTPD